MKMTAKTYAENPFEQGDVLRLIETEKRNKSMRQGDHWVKVIDEVGELIGVMTSSGYRKKSYY